MNYRHAFHAGNFADVFKHAILSRILLYLIRKPAPLRYIDTHAGAGWYDLGGDEAGRTGEWRDGIGHVHGAADDALPLLAPYLSIVGPRDSGGKPQSYPGSAAIAQHLLRPTDHLLLCERHPEEAVALKRSLGRDKRVKILPHDGYRVLNASVPPPERRGLVLIDPPFEEPNEFGALAGALAGAVGKWPTGVYVLWYPIKNTASVAQFSANLRSLSLPRWLSLRLERERPAGDERLKGTGLYIVNPTFGLKAEAEAIGAFLAARFGRAGTGQWHCSVADADS